MSPSPEEGFSRNITIVTRTEVAEISEVVKNEDRSHGAVMRTSGGLKVQVRASKSAFYTFILWRYGPGLLPAPRCFPFIFF